MKSSLLILSFLFAFAYAFGQEADSAAIKFDNEKHDFGDITQGSTVENVFTFTNPGKKALVISNVITSCGCTAPTWPKEPIPPKGKGEIKIVFNSTGKMGMQNKVITIISNAAGGSHRITITANVLAPKKE
jgi:hypothetical protein